MRLIKNYHRVELIYWNVFVVCVWPMRVISSETGNFESIKLSQMEKTTTEKKICRKKAHLTVSNTICLTWIETP